MLDIAANVRDRVDLDADPSFVASQPLTTRRISCQRWFRSDLPGTVKHTRDMLRRVLRYAFQHGALSANPAPYDSTLTSTSASGICSHVAIRSRATCQSDAHQRLFSDAITRRFGVRTQTLYPNQLSTRARQQTRLRPQTTTIEFGPTWSHGWSGRVGIIVMAEQEPLAMPLEEAMRTQRAIRRIKSDPVDDSLLLHLLELAMKAPTGSNAQNWEFIVVKDREVVAKLGRLNRRAMNLVSPIYKRIIARRMDDQMLRIEKAVRWQADHFDDIPVVVVACLKGVVAPWPSMAASSAYGSIYPAVQNFLLAARAAGLGATLITMPLWSKLLAQRALGLPWNVTPCAVIPLGWPIGKYGPTTRRPVGEFVSLDQYGNRAFL